MSSPRPGGQSMRMTSYALRSGSSASLRQNSRRSLLTSVISLPARSRLDGITSPYLVCRTADAASVSPSNRSKIFGPLSRLPTPKPEVALPCGSKSTSSTLYPASVSPADRLTAVVVLPTPPFWFATATISAPVDSCDICPLLSSR